MRVRELIANEEYHSLAGSPINKVKYPVFVNPDRSEIRELAQEANLARFIAYGQDLYLFSAALLHAFAIRHLELPISSTPPIEQAFLGVAKVNTNGTMQFYDTNQEIKDFSAIAKHYAYLSKWFGW